MVGLALVLLAGCASETGAPAASTPTDASTPSPSSVVSYSPEPTQSGGPDPPPADEAGIIKGTVVDDQKLPLENVTVEVDSGATKAATNGSGQFEILGIPAGTHVLIFHAPRYFPAERTLEILPGQVAEIRVEMVLDPNSTEPHMEHLLQNGLITCGIWFGSAGGCQMPGAGHANSHKFVFPYSGLNMTVFEVFWTPQSDALADNGLQDLQLQIMDCTGANLLGTSNHVRHITFRASTPKTPTPRSAICVTEPNVQARIDVAPHRISEGKPPGFLAGDQRYEFWLSLAYHFIPPADYTVKPA